MAEIRAFKGVVYNGAKIGGDYSRVVAPPYDVIPDSQRDALYDKSEYNIIRLILGKSFEGDNDADNKYVRAGKTFDEWQKESVMTRDDNEALYIYRQEYNFKGEHISRTGFIGLMKIGEAGKDAVLPHEHTLAKPKEDRMNLIRSVESNLSPIFSLYYDKEGLVIHAMEEGMSAEEPFIDTKVGDQRHQVWRLTDSGLVESILSNLADKKVFIADGHHRYEVSRAYRALRRKEPEYDGSADYVMMYFTDMTRSDNLTVMATHRVLKDMPLSEEEVIKKAGAYFDVREAGSLPDLMGSLENGGGTGHVFGYFSGRKYISMKAKDESVFLDLMKEDKSKDWKTLDVSILHSLMFDNILDINAGEGNITYVRDAEDAEALVKDGSHAAAFLLNPTKVEQLKAVAEQGEMMPQKSTYFYPKLLSGLVINKLEDNSAANN